jgi:putative multiple sugar transport system permease protein
MSRVKDVFKKNTMLVALVFIIVLFELIIYIRKGAGISLLGPTNITNLINQNSYVVILACGMLLCILTGGNIDLAIGANVVLVGAIGGQLIVNMHFSIPLSIMLCLGVGLVLGAWQGFWIAYMRIPAFIVTLAMSMTFRGIAQLMLGGLTVSPFPTEYTQLFINYIPGRAHPALIYPVTMIAAGVVCVLIIVLQVIKRVRKQKTGAEQESLIMTIIRTAIICGVIMVVGDRLGHDKGIPVILIILGVVVAAYSYFTQNTVPGRRLYAMGGNEKAAKLSGINTNRILFFTYTNLGFLGAVASLVCAARFNSVAPTAGMGYELDTIAACYIGGASAYGGVGTIKGAVIGAIFMGVLNIGMSLASIDQYWQSTVKGIVLLTAVAIDVLSRNRRKSR